MQDRYSKQATMAKPRIEDVFGPPRGNKTPNDKGGPPRDQRPLHVTLLAEGTETAPVRKGTGSSPSDLKEAARVSNDKIAAEQKQDAPANSSLGDLSDIE